jgi:antitoxin MazE
MRSTIRKMGNSQGVLLPKHVLAEVGVRADDAVDIKVKKGKIIISPVEREHPRAGWAEASKAIHAAGDDKLVWPEFGNEGDKDLEW